MRLFLRLFMRLFVCSLRGYLPSAGSLSDSAARGLFGSAARGSDSERKRFDPRRRHK